jgi:hypothetical protein
MIAHDLNVTIFLIENEGYTIVSLLDNVGVR